MSNNAVFVLYPTRSPFGVWAFDDDQRGLVNEPFVGETNRLIDKMAEESGYDLKDNPQIALLFSEGLFPDFQCYLQLQISEESGSTYRDLISYKYIWLCPAFYKYYKTAPVYFYGAVVKKS